MVDKSVCGKVVVTIDADDWDDRINRFDKSMDLCTYLTSKIDWLVWSSIGWRWCLRPFIRFHFWWTKPV